MSERQRESVAFVLCGVLKSSDGAKEQKTGEGGRKDGRKGRKRGSGAEAGAAATVTVHGLGGGGRYLTDLYNGAFYHYIISRTRQHKIMAIIL